MEINYIELTKKAELFKELLTADKQFIESLFNCYGNLSDACLGSAGREVIDENAETYEIILNSDIIDFITFYNISESASTFNSTYPHLRMLLDTSSSCYIQRILKDVICIEPVASISNIQEIRQSMSTFGIPEVISLDIGDLDDFSNLEDIEGFDNIGISPEDLTADTQSNYRDTDNKNEDDFNDLKAVWGSDLSNVINSIMKSYSSLYKSGYGLVSPSGVLTDQGIIKSNTDGKLCFTGDRVIDIKLYNAITEVTGDIFTHFASENSEPNISDTNTEYPVTYSSLHIKNTFGHLNYCTGKHGLRRYLTKNNIENKSDTKIIRYSDMQGWIKESIERYFYQAYRDLGITCDINADNIQKVESINTTMSRSLKNVILVAERKPKVSTRLRICSDNALSVQSIISNIKNRLNVGTSSNIEVITIGDYENGVADINIVYNTKAYRQDSLFAYQVLDILQEQGMKPSWDNVIMGKKDDGTIMTYNFKDKTNAAYALYASTRSGKGVMTLNLLASALADNCKLIYIDGKPDMGEVLTDICWKDNLDVCVFNGIQGKGNISLENRGNCIRDYTQYIDIGRLPKNIFNTEEEKRKFIQTVTYLRGLELISILAKKRAELKPNNSDWVVAVVDECEQASVLESEVNAIIDASENERKHAVDQNGKKINYVQDEAYIFIQNYKKWLGVVISNFKQCVSSTFGQANMTVFFVWQSTKFPGKYVNESYIAKTIESCNGILTKIVGRGAAVANGSTCFGTPTSLKNWSWYDNRFSGSHGGFFAIGKEVNSDNMEVFRPFNVFSDSKNKELIIENAKTNGLSESDLYNVTLNSDGSVIPEVGFEGYASKLLERYNMSVSQQLNIGYRYADEIIRANGLGESLLHFMYNYYAFEAFDPSVDGSMSNISNGLNIDGIMNDEFGANGAKYDNIRLDGDEEINFGFNDNVAPSISNTGRSESMSQFDQEMIQRARNITEKEKINASPEIINNQQESAYKFGTKADDYYTFITPSKTAKILNLNDENSCTVTVKDHRDMNTSNKLFKTLKGTNYELASRWDSILSAIAKKQSPDTITTVVLFNDAMIFNKRQIAAVGLLGGQDGVEVRDIVNFKLLSKYFRNIRKLSIDTEVYEASTVELGDTPEVLLFNMFPQLIHLSIWKPGYNESPITYDRQSLNSEKTRMMQKENRDRARLKQGIDAFAASNNPRFNQKSSIERSRVINGAKSLTGAGWEKCKRQYGKDHFVASAVLGAFTISAAVITGSLMGITKIGSMFAKR